MNIPETHLKRFEDYFRSKWNYNIDIRDDLLFLKSIGPHKFLDNLLNDDSLAWRYVNRVYFTDKQTESYERIADLEDYENKVGKEGFSLRVQAHPSELEERLLKEMDKKFDLNPKTFSHFLSVVREGEKLHYGLCPKDLFYRKPRRSYEPINKSYYKLREAINRFDVELKKDWTVLDVGASPGGWTEYLSDKVGKIIAVDPGELKIDEKNIKYIPELVEDCVAQLKKYAPFDMIVSDINENPREYSKILKPVFPLLKEAGPFISTIKLVYKGEKSKQELVESTKEELGSYFRDIEVKWLFANTKYERTFYGTKR